MWLRNFLYGVAMRFTTKTEYGILCMIHLAKHSDMPCVTIKQIAQKENYPAPYIEKILQALRHSGLVKAHHGNQGGYSLARTPSEISLRQIIDSLEGSTFEIFCQPEVRDEIVCTHFCLCGVKPVWRKTKQILDDFYSSVTLDMLTQDEMQTQKILISKGSHGH